MKMNNCRRHYFVDASIYSTYSHADQFFFIGGGVIVKMVQKAYKLLSQKLFADAQAIPLSELVTVLIIIFGLCRWPMAMRTAVFEYTYFTFFFQIKKTRFNVFLK